MSQRQPDGIQSLMPLEQMCEGAQKLRTTYAITPGAPLYRTEFGFFGLELWKEQGMPQDVPMHELFGYDPGGAFTLGQLGWCEAEFKPCFDTIILENRGDHELVQDYAGRHVLFFKERRNGFMPEYVDHPVKDMKTWEENVKWRLNPTSPERFADLEARMEGAIAAAGQGMMIVQNVIGGYMYLRSLIGPGELPFAFYDMPDVIHDCMETWLALAYTVVEKHQQYVTFDEVFFGEDICYNHGSLISPDMMREFILPYYQQFMSNVRTRQIDKERKLFIHIDTDGFADPVIDVYRDSIGMNVMSPFEVASDCDVVRTGEKYPDLVIKGGIDKRIMARSHAEIDAMLERILPAMRARGGFVPTCDHGVPEEVTYENYLYFRKRCIELGG